MFIFTSFSFPVELFSSKNFSLLVKKKIKVNNYWRCPKARISGSNRILGLHLLSFLRNQRPGYENKTKGTDGKYSATDQPVHFRPRAQAVEVLEREYFTFVRNVLCWDANVQPHQMSKSIPTTLLRSSRHNVSKFICSSVSLLVYLSSFLTVTIVLLLTNLRSCKC